MLAKIGGRIVNSGQTKTGKIGDRYERSTLKINVENRWKNGEFSVNKNGKNR